MKNNKDREPNFAVGDTNCLVARKRLYRAYRKVFTWQALADQLGMNVNPLYYFVMDGIEPTDKTEKGQDMRQRMGLSRRKRKPAQPRPPVPAWLKRVKRGIAGMVKQTRESVLLVKHK